MATKKPKPTPDPLAKTTLYLSAAAKRRLAYAKADLRAVGIPTSESKIVDALISHSDVDQLAKWLK
jgi:hypothetical protein